jgi:N-acetylneuraminate synthase/N,N'-diacetyllegionaminate synthase
MLACRRPASGIAPRELPLLVGRVARVAIAAGTIVQWDQLEDGAAR